MNRGFFMHNRGRYFVQQGSTGAGGGASPFSFTDPTFGGSVLAIIDDGAGGKYVGGTFTSVTCNVTATTYTTGYTRLIHLLATGEVDAAWSCPLNTNYAQALALDVANDVLYVGGNFSAIGGETRACLAAVTASTGVVDTDWTCNTGQVFALALDVANDRLYVGGGYSTIGGEPRADLAAVTASTGVVDAAWTCNTSGSDYVETLALDVANDILYVGGNISFLAGVPRKDLAAVTASTGVLVLGWTCNTPGAGLVYVLALDVANDRLYVGGAFTAIGGKSRADLAAVTASTGVVDAAWTCNTASGEVRALAVDSSADRLYVGGTFTNIDSASPAKLRLAAITASTGDVDAAWQCDAGSTVRALQVDPANNALFVGGFFNGATGLDGEQRDRFGTVVASTGDLFVP